VEVAETQALIRRALRRAKVRFGGGRPAPDLGGIPGVKVLTQGGDSAVLQIEGEMDVLIKALAQYPVVEFETERPSLEEVFLAYYER
jgi:ABC-2 type transport system ATP-binding protein